MNVSKKRGRSRSARPVKRFKKRQAVPAVLQMRRPEKNGVDTLISSEFNVTAPMTLLNATVPGDNINNRKGRKISMVSLSLRGFVRFADSGGSPGTSDYLRLIVFYDRQPNGAAPAIADLLQDTNAAGATQTVSYSNLNLSNADRFKILIDDYWAPQGTVGATTGYAYDGLQNSYTNNVKHFIPLKGLETHYNAGTAGTIADITTGSLYLVTMGIPGDADAQWRFLGEARIRYHDQ